MTLLLDNRRSFPTSAAPNLANPLRTLPSELVNEIRRLVLAIRMGDAVKSVAVLGVEPKAGASSVASILAFALSDSGQDVLLLDATASESQRAILNIEPATKSLPGEGSLWSFRTRWTGIRLAEPARDTSAGLTQAVHQALVGTDSLVVDCPAMQSSVACLEIAHHLDGILLVVKAGSSKKKHVTNCVHMLRSARIPILGIVVNCAAGIQVR
jgi:Mrp family chromosome partitioning ATPase